MAEVPYDIDTSPLICSFTKIVILSYIFSWWFAFILQPFLINFEDIG